MATRFWSPNVIEQALTSYIYLLALCPLAS